MAAGSSGRMTTKSVPLRHDLHVKSWGPGFMVAVDTYKSELPLTARRTTRVSMSSSSTNLKYAHEPTSTFPSRPTPNSSMLSALPLLALPPAPDPPPDTLLRSYRVSSRDSATRALSADSVDSKSKLATSGVTRTGRLRLSMAPGRPRDGNCFLASASARRNASAVACVRALMRFAVPLTPRCVLRISARARRRASRSEISVR